MTSPSRHAFWTPSYDQRGSRLNKILIIKLDTMAPNGDSNEANNIEVRATTVGYTVTKITNYTAFLNEDLTKYAHIWDLGYNTVIPLLVQYKYINYLQNGGAAFLIGENPYFQARNDSVCLLIGAAGGGTVTTGGGGGNITVPIVPEFLLDNQTPTVTFSAPSGFPNYGTGTPVTTGLTCAVMWKTGSLSNCVRGALISILDVNFLQTQYLQSDFIENLIAMLNRK